MRIASISAHIMGVPGAGGRSPARNWLFVRVDTDEGLTGVGEATTEFHELAVAAMVERHFAPLLIGRDPTRIQDIWATLQRCFWWRNGVVAASASSGIEQALWDITGKAYGQPVHRLLGGAVRERIPLYARGDLGLPSPLDELQEAQRQGYTAFKFGPFWKGNFEERRLAQSLIDTGRQLRSAVGEDVSLMIDCGGIFSLKEAVRLLREMEAVRLTFAEEVVNADSPGDLVALRQAVPSVPIAAGERLATRWAFREWLERGAVDIIQPDVCHCGGIGELLRIAAYAEVHNVRVAPHNPYGPVAFAAGTQACAVMPNFLMLEHCRHTPWSAGAAPAATEIRAGCAYWNERPGLGVEIDWEYVQGHPPLELPAPSPRDPWGGTPPI
jgi:galactonate dehydratase